MGAQDYESLVNLYHGIFLYCGIAALVFLGAAILLFILLKIPRVFAELSGRVAKKAIAQMSEDGAVSGDLNTSRRIGDDGRRHRKGRTGALGTSRLRRKSGSLSGGLATEKMGAGHTGEMNGSSGGLGSPSGGLGSPSGGLGSLSGGLGSPSGGLNGGAGALGNPSGGLGLFPGQVQGNGNSYVPGDGSAPTDVLSGFGLPEDGSAPTDVLSPAAAASSSGQNPLASFDGPSSQESTASRQSGDWNGAYDPARTETMALGGGPGGFMVLRTIMEVHTDEVI